jgi:hypothetical protein
VPSRDRIEALRAAGIVLLGRPAEHTVMTAAISGRPARCLANRFTALAKTLATVPFPSGMVGHFPEAPIP